MPPSRIMAAIATLTTLDALLVALTEYLPAGGPQDIVRLARAQIAHLRAALDNAL